MATPSGGFGRPGHASIERQRLCQPEEISDLLILRGGLLWSGGCSRPDPGITTRKR